MRKIIFILLLTMLCTSIFARLNEPPDIVIYNNTKYIMDLNSNYSGSILNKFYMYKGYIYPFHELSSRNRRGFIATWEIKNSQLYLKKVNIDKFLTVGKYKNVNIPLRSIFYQHVRWGRVKASWFSGKIRLDNIDTGESIIVDIRNGNLGDYNKKHNPIKLTIAQQEKTKRKIDAIKVKYRKRAKRLIEREEARERKYAKSVYSKMDGYKNINNRYAIYDSTAYSNELNIHMKDLLFEKIDIIWKNPIVDKIPTYDWNDLNSIYVKILEVIENNEWLKEWGYNGEEYYIKIYINGKSHSSQYSEERDLVLWGHAELQGRYKYRIILQNKRDHAEVLYGDDENRGLITYCNRYSGYPEYVAFHGIEEINTIINKQNPTWLNQFEFGYNDIDKTRNYLIVNPDGTWKIHEMKWNGIN